MREREGAQQQTKPEDLPDQANIIYASGESRNVRSKTFIIPYYQEQSPKNF